MGEGDTPEDAVIPAFIASPRFAAIRLQEPAAREADREARIAHADGDLSHLAKLLHRAQPGNLVTEGALAYGRDGDIALPDLLGQLIGHRDVHPHVCLSELCNFYTTVYTTS